MSNRITEIIHKIRINGKDGLSSDEIKIDWELSTKYLNSILGSKEFRDKVDVEYIPHPKLKGRTLALYKLKKYIN